MPASQLPSEQHVLGAVSVQADVYPRAVIRDSLIEACAGLESLRARLAGVEASLMPSVIAAGSVNTLVRPELPATQRLESESRLSICRRCQSKDEGALIRKSKHIDTHQMCHLVCPDRE